MTLSTTGSSQVRLTVRELEVSRRSYDRVFGWDVAYELPADADQATRDRLWFLFGGVIDQVPGGLLGLRPAAPGDDASTEDRVGLDHLSSSVASTADLEAAVAVLDAAGAPHGEVEDAGAMHLLEFRDPDGIALELVAVKG